MNPVAVNDYLVDLQNRLVAALERVDGRRFRRDRWRRSEGGGGESSII
jgi:coproporphyrinogen III oxidase